MNKKSVAALFAGLVVFAGAQALALPPGGINKKHIGLLFDVMKTTPSNILAHADQFVEHAPYLDGVAISLNSVSALDANGNVVTSGLTQVMHKSIRWTRDAVRHHIPVLKEISRKPHLTESFLLFWMSPKMYEDRLAWTDDKAWANYAENMAVVSWLAKEGGMKGLMLDPEEYANARQFKHKPEDPPFSKCKEIARQRGREVFSRVFKEHPDTVLFTLWFFGASRSHMENGRQTNPVAYGDDTGDLLRYFYNGILDVMPPTARIVDGCEHYSLSATRNQYMLNAFAQSTGALALVAPGNHVKYRSQVLFSNTHYLDMFTLGANPKSHWYHGPVNGSRLEHLRLNLEQSLLTATEYVWIYGEGGGKLFNWRDGNFEKKQTWEEVIPGMTETIMLVKDPERYAAMRRAKLEAEGKLVNLLEEIKPIRLENPAGVRHYREPGKDMPAVKGVKEGERYLVSVMVRTGRGRNGAGRKEAACPRVFWRWKGKTIDAAGVPLAVPAEVGSKFVKAECVATVPAGADELMLDLGADLFADETISYQRPTICNALDPVKVEAAVPASKWVLDLKKRTLSNGHWKLKAWMSKERLYVGGDGTNTVGGGVLDLRNVKADTGYDIHGLSRFGGCTSITGLIAPDVPLIEPRSFWGCDNIKVVAIGNLPPFTREFATPNELRRDHLARLSLRKELADGRKRVSFKHPAVVDKRFGGGLVAKNIQPGALYNVSLAMKRTGAGLVRIGVKFRGNGRMVGEKKLIGMKEPREDGVWRTGECVLRAPEGAEEICFDFFATLNEGADTFEFDKFKVYKIGDPLPVWPAESLREKGR